MVVVVAVEDVVVDDVVAVDVDVVDAVAVDVAIELLPDVMFPVFGFRFVGF